VHVVLTPLLQPQKFALVLSVDNTGCVNHNTEVIFDKKYEYKNIE
jgi:hypothetical protein